MLLFVFSLFECTTKRERLARQQLANPQRQEACSAYKHVPEQEPLSAQHAQICQVKCETWEAQQNKSIGPQGQAQLKRGSLSAKMSSPDFEETPAEHRVDVIVIHVTQS